MESKEERQIEEKYKLLVSLWTSENQVKTAKLQAFALVSSIFVSAFILVPGARLFIALIGMLFSVVWLFSIGRTLHYQSCWRSQIDEIRGKYKDNAIMFDIFNPETLNMPKPGLFSKISSKRILLGMPLAATFVWLATLLWVAIWN